MARATGEDRFGELRWLPLIVFGMIYFATFVVGSLLLLSGWRSFEVLFQKFTGVYSFFLTPEALLTDLLLTFAAPALLVFGYWAALRTAKPGLPLERSSRGPDAKVIWLVWVSSIVIAGVSLARVGAVRYLFAWFNYREWIEARLKIFGTLKFFEFVNMYVVLPVLTSLVVLLLWRRPWTKGRRIFLVALASVPLGVVDVLLFQKRYLLLSLFQVASAALIMARMQPKAPRALRPLWKNFVFIGAVGYVIYCVLVVMPSISTLSQVMAVRQERPAVLGPPASVEVAQPGAPPGAGSGAGPALTRPEAAAPIAWRKRVFESVLASVLPGRWVGPAPNDDQSLSLGRRSVMLFFFAMFSPVIRTPPAALAYPAIFPQRIPYFGLDLGGDILGWGRMPDDNLKVYAVLYNTAQAGATAVPFQFAFYSQVGLAGSLLLSALLGYVLARGWLVCLAGTMGSELSAAAGALLVLLGAYLAMDSFRNSFIASYGVGWGLLFLVILFLLGGRSRSETTAVLD